MPPRSRGGGKRSKRRSQPLYAEDCAEETGIRRGELHRALQRPDDYVRACQELAALLRLAYAICTKHLQRYLEEQCLAAVECCSSKQRDRKALDAVCREAKKRFPKQQAAQVEKAYKQLCVTQQRELKRQEAQRGDDDEEAPVQTVPPEVLAKALALLPPQDLAAAMCVDRSWSQAASSPALWEAFARRTFAPSGYAGAVAKASRDENREAPWHAVFSRMAKMDSGGSGPVERWRHNRVVVRGRLSWRDAFDPVAFHANSIDAADRSQATVMFPTPEEAARIMLGEALSSSSSSDDSSDDDDEGEESGEGGAAPGVPSHGAGESSAAAADGAGSQSRRRQLRLWAVPESMRNLSLE